MINEIKEIKSFLSREKFAKGFNPFTSIYVTSNEFAFEKILRILQEQTKNFGQAYFGISGLQNWDILVQIKPRIAILADCNPKVVQFHKKMLQILNKVKTPQDFLDQTLKKIKKDLQKNKKAYEENVRFGYDVKEIYKIYTLEQAVSHELTQMFKRKRGSLSNENFSFLKEMALEGRIQTVCLDIAYPENIKKIVDFVKCKGFQFSCLYLSNAYDYLLGDRKKNFVKSVNLLKENNTWIIDTTLQNCIWMVKSYLLQAVDPITNKEYDPEKIRILEGQGTLIDRTSFYQFPHPLSLQDTSKYQLEEESLLLSDMVKRQLAS